MTNTPMAQAKLRLAMFAGLSMLAMAPAAHAVVVTYAGPAIPVPATLAGLYVNVVTNAANTVPPVGWDFNVYAASGALTFFTNAAPSAYVGVGTAVSALPLGTIIGPASTFAAGGINAGTAFQTTGNRYFGFRFNNESGGTTHYGYGLLSLGATAGFPASILSYAFESTPGLAITVVPEPSTYALMALGLAAVGGIAARRRKAETAA